MLTFMEAVRRHWRCRHEIWLRKSPAWSSILLQHDSSLPPPFSKIVNHSSDHTSSESIAINCAINRNKSVAINCDSNGCNCVQHSTRIDITTALGRIQPVTLGGAISVIFGSQISLRVHYRKRDEVYFTTLLWQNNEGQKWPYSENAVFQIVQSHGE